MKNNLIKLLTFDKEIRLYIADTTNILEHSTLKDMKTDFAKQLYTKIFTNCSLLRGFLTEKDQRINVNIRFKPEGCSAYCDIDGSGNIHCTFSSRLKVFDGKFIDLIGEDAILSITRGSWMGGMFTGTVELNSDSVERCFSDFYSKSEQIETIFRIWIGNGIVRGCMIQPLPFYSDDNLKNVIKSIDNSENCLITDKWAELPNKTFSNARIIEEYTLQTECNCSKEMFFGILMSVDLDELKESIHLNQLTSVFQKTFLLNNYILFVKRSKEMFFGILMSVDLDELKESIQMNKNEELECGICGKKYVFNGSDLETIVKIRERG